MTGDISLDNRLSGSITVDGDFTGTLTTDNRVDGWIDIGGDLKTPGQISITGDVVRTDIDEPPTIRVRGSVLRGTAPFGPVIEVLSASSDMQGSIAIDGSFQNAAPNDVEVVSRPFDSSAGLPFFTVDYDGWDANDSWPTVGGTGADSGGTFEIRPSAGASTLFTGNDPDERVYEITACFGDMNNDGFADADDVDPLDRARPDPDFDCYIELFPGLKESVHYHGDLSNDGAISCIDVEWHEYLRDVRGYDLCCFTERSQIAIARIDVNFDGVIDLADLAGLLSAFGTDESNPAYDLLYDTTAADCAAVSACNNEGEEDPNESVDLADLAGLLAVFGNSQSTCDANGGPGGGGGGGAGFGGSPITLSVSAFDTSGYSGSGFEGEDEHFVFDLIIEVDQSSDDWTAGGAYVTAENKAALRIAPYNPSDPNSAPEPTGSGEPNKYVCFVGVPKAVNVAGRFTTPGASYAGGYDTPSTLTYTTAALDMGWYHLSGTSNDGPAAIARVVIDVSGVAGADTSGGFGSVYFSQSGPTSGGDIKVADFSSAASVSSTEEALYQHNGAFYVTD